MQTITQKKYNYDENGKIILTPNPRPRSPEERARRAAAFARLRSYKGIVDFKFDIKKELTEAHIEKYENSLRH